MNQADPLGALVAAAEAAAAANNYPEAIRLQSEAVELVRQAGDAPDYLAARGILLFNLANLYEANGRLPEAIAALEQVVALDEQLQSPDLAQDQAALARLRHLATLSPAEQAAYSLAETQALVETLAEEARQAALQGERETAVAAQLQAVAVAQQLGNSVAELTQLGVLLHNLAGYQQDVGDFAAAVEAMSAVVAIDEQIDAPELENDRESLAQLQQLAAMSPAARQDFLAAAQRTAAQLQQMTAAEKERLAASVQKANENLATMNPAERKMAVLGAAKEMLAQLAQQVRETAVAVQRGQQTKTVLFAQLAQLEGQISENTNFGIARYDFISYLQAVDALVRGERVKAVPKLYQAHVKAIRKAKRKG